MFDHERTDKVDDVLLVRYFKHLKMDCLDLSIECKCKAFVSTPIVQKILHNMWLGNKTDNSIIVIYFHLT